MDNGFANLRFLPANKTNFTKIVSFKNTTILKKDECKVNQSYFTTNKANCADVGGSSFFSLY
jgi:hypothetical protein